MYETYHIIFNIKNSFQELSWMPRALKLFFKSTFVVKSLCVHCTSKHLQLVH